MLKAVQEIVKVLSLKENKDYAIHIIKSLPLIHFLRGTCTPFEKVSPTPADIIGDSALRLEHVKSTMKCHHG